VPSALGLPMGPSSARPRIALMVVLLAAAMPVRISGSFPVINSVSVLDLLLLVFGLTLLLDLASRPLDTGYRDLFSLLCIPLVVAIASIAWSDDRPATLRAVLIYAEGIIAYLFVVRELSDLPPARVITYIKRYSYLLIAPGVLLLLHVPGFAPQEAGLSHSSGTYLSYYSRLSHPILGRSNNLASLLAFFAPLLFYWGHRRRDRGVAIAAFITLVAIFLTLSRGVLLAFLIAGLLYAPLALGRRRIPGGGIAAKLAATVALAGIAIAVLYTVNPATHEFFAGRLTLANVHGRTALISASLDEIARRPLLGYGGGQHVPTASGLLRTTPWPRRFVVALRAGRRLLGSARIIDSRRRHRLHADGSVGDLPIRVELRGDGAAGPVLPLRRARDRVHARIRGRATAGYGAACLVQPSAPCQGSGCAVHLVGARRRFEASHTWEEPSNAAQPACLQCLR
jgi:O-antigen ligase